MNALSIYEQHFLLSVTGATKQQQQEFGVSRHELSHLLGWVPSSIWTWVLEWNSEWDWDRLPLPLMRLLLCSSAASTAVIVCGLISVHAKERRPR
uniref:HDC07242 n=1 Tax=Drosophila melanogaster TaxID=7227 RepID=Q6IG47_DROME|nr:TPA_inf: HDC07242 [Drosophila melanogaster]